MTHVVDHRHEPYDVYIGRPSIWGNPFTAGRGTSRTEAIKKYEEYLRSKPELMARVHELKGLTLGCWCSPLPCHGDILAAIADQQADDREVM